MLPFPPSSKCLICRLEIMGHVSNWYISLQTADPTLKWDANLIIPHVQSRNRISLLNLFSYVGKIKNKRSWSGLCERNVLQFIKPWGNEIRAPEGFFLPHGIIITSKCFFSEIFAPHLCTPKETLIPFSGAWISSNNLQFLQIIPFKHLVLQPRQTICLFKLIWDKNGGIINYLTRIQTWV